MGELPFQSPDLRIVILASLSRFGPGVLRPSAICASRIFVKRATTSG